MSASVMMPIGWPVCVWVTMRAVASARFIRYAAAPTWSFCSTVVTGGRMMSATVAAGCVECCAEGSAMVCSLEDPITLLGIGSHRWARGGACLCGIRRRAGQAQASTRAPEQAHPGRVQSTPPDPWAGPAASQDQWASRRERDADQREKIADQRERDADQRDAGLDNRARALGLAVAGRPAGAREASARSQAKVARTGEAIERCQAALRREEARQQWERARARPEHDAPADHPGQDADRRDALAN